MAYIINLTDGSIFATVPDGTINVDSSQTLVGKNYAGYGEFLGENFIRILESAANNTAPSAPLTGQLWFDKTVGVLKVYNGTNFKNLGAASSDVTEPLNPVIGDLWYNPTVRQLFVQDPNVTENNGWILIGPSFTAGTGVSGAIVNVITDNFGDDHTVVELYVNDEIIGIISKDELFQPATPIHGFDSISPGIQLTKLGTNGILGGDDARLFVGTAENALNLLDSNGNPINSDSFVRNDNSLTEEMVGSLWVRDTLNGIQTGPNGAFSISSDPGDPTGDSNIIKNSVPGKSMAFQVEDFAGASLVINSDGRLSTEWIAQPGDGDDTIVNKKYIDDALDNVDISGVLLADGTVTLDGVLKPTLNNTISLGSFDQQFTTVYAVTFSGTSTTAKYADLAERFEIDKSMPAGTVVELGGEKEITEAVEKFSDEVFGVISTNAAYLMNSEAGEDDTHPAVAMNGRVPVRVTGKINKGDRLVSAGNGLAQSANSDELTPFNVIGRALENKDTDGEGVVEAIVRIN